MAKESLVPEAAYVPWLVRQALRRFVNFQFIFFLPSWLRFIYISQTDESLVLSQFFYSFKSFYFIPILKFLVLNFLNLLAFLSGLCCQDALLHISLSVSCSFFSISKISSKNSFLSVDLSSSRFLGSGSDYTPSLSWEGSEVCWPGSVQIHVSVSQRSSCGTSPPSS